MLYIRVKHAALFNHRAKTKERQYNRERLLEVVRRKINIASTNSQ